jgi:HlyD family secretion protein
VTQLELSSIGAFRTGKGSAAAMRGLQRSRRAVIMAACIATVIVAGLGILRPQVFASPAVKYREAPLDRGPIVSAISTAGTVKPLAAILVGSQASGQIKELGADFNSRVVRGDVIARLDDDAVRARLDQAVIEVDVAAAAVDIQRAQLERARADADGARAGLAAARADVERAEMTVRDAERDRDRKRELFARGVSSTAERDRVETAYETALTLLAAARARETVAVSAEASHQATIRIAIAQVENAVAQVKQRQAIVRQIRIDVEHTVIRAPIDGIVIERSVDIGQTVAASLQAPTIFTIAPDLRAMQVHANVDESDIGRVVTGQEVAFTVDAFPGRSFQGRVVDIHKMPQSAQNVVTYTVVISADNEDLLLMPGMTANARILVQQRDQALRVPNAALRFRPAGQLARGESAANGEVWVIGAAGVPEARRLRLGVTDGVSTEVVASDLRAGDRVITGAESEAAKPAWLARF